MKALLFLLAFLIIIYLLPEIPVDEDGKEVLDGRDPPPPCDYHSWDKINGRLQCKVCGRRGG